MDIVIVDGLARVMFVNGRMSITPVTYPSPGSPYAIWSWSSYPILKFPPEKNAEHLRYLVVGIERVRIFHSLELGDDVSVPQHHHVTIRRAWEGMTVKLALEVRRICQTTSRHGRSSEENCCVRNFGVDGNLGGTNNSSFGRRLHCFLAVDEGVHQINRRCTWKGEIVW